jgi:hypothetical protein
VATVSLLFVEYFWSSLLITAVTVSFVETVQWRNINTKEYILFIIIIIVESN